MGMWLAPTRGDRRCRVLAAERTCFAGSGVWAERHQVRFEHDGPLSLEEPLLWIRPLSVSTSNSLHHWRVEDRAVHGFWATAPHAYLRISYVLPLSWVLTGEGIMAIYPIVNPSG